MGRLAVAEVMLDRQMAKAGQLPPVCVYSGRPATGVRQKVFVGSTPFTVFAGGGVPRAKLPISDEYRGFAWRRRAIVGLLLALTFGGVYVLAEIGTPAKPGPWAQWMPRKGPLTLAVLGLFATTVIGHTWFFYTDVRCTELTWDTMTLKNVSPEFAAACSAGPLIQAELCDEH
jgi:hypothetical protein